MEELSQKQITSIKSAFESILRSDYISLRSNRPIE